MSERLLRLEHQHFFIRDDQVRAAVAVVVVMVLIVLIVLMLMTMLGMTGCGCVFPHSIGIYSGRVLALFLPVVLPLPLRCRFSVGHSLHGCHQDCVLLAVLDGVELAQEAPAPAEHGRNDRLRDPRLLSERRVGPFVLVRSLRNESPECDVARVVGGRAAPPQQDVVHSDAVRDEIVGAAAAASCHAGAGCFFVLWSAVCRECCVVRSAAAVAVAIVGAAHEARAAAEESADGRAG
mmetsp:Transcript_15167/g.42757  ORF Transcript_15167/g.42757 Transcript_15167/m.42757 type:complete len:236 (+) Transcript_15167:750-1457(+)